MTIVRKITELYKTFKPQERGWRTREDAENIHNELDLTFAPTQRLREIRDIIVLAHTAIAPKDREGDNWELDMELWDKMSGFVAVVDNELWKRGEAV